MLDYFDNKTILVVGASGYIGSKLVSELSNCNCTIKRVTRDKVKLKPIKDSQAEIINFEINYNNVVWKELIEDVDIIYYLSSQTSVYIAEKDLIEDYESSVKPFVKLLNSLEKYNKRPIIAFSSAATVCGLTDTLPVDENFADKPITIYDIHKQTIENYLKYYSMKNTLYGFSLRLANVYGPGGESSSNDRGIINQMVKKALNGDDLTLYGDGNFLRDYIYIDDVVNAFLLGVKNIEITNGNHYLIASGNGKILSEAFDLIATKVSKITSKNISINKIEAPENLARIEYRNFIGSNEKFKNATGWKPVYDFDSGIYTTINYFLKD